METLFGGTDPGLAQPSLAMVPNRFPKFARAYTSRVGDVEEKSAIVIPFLELDDVVDSWRRLLDPAQVRGIPAHVTVLFPFVDPTDLSTEILNALETHFSRARSFNVAFHSTAWFEDRVVYLEPKPEQQFRTMTKQLLRALLPVWRSTSAAYIGRIQLVVATPQLWRCQWAGQLGG
jgi:hypothetical protein